MTWIQTLSGLRFDLENPQSHQININDIATSLSRQCRYAGHCIRFYSVAEHCVLAAGYADYPHKLSTLMHDASEAYLIDVPRPVKRMLLGYQEIESRIMAAIAKKYHFDWPLSDYVKLLDSRMLTVEREQNMMHRPEDGVEWGAPDPGVDVELQYWNPGRAKREFLGAFTEYSWED